MSGGRPTGRPDPLERLLALRREQFVREHWGRSPLLVTAAERADRAEDLFSVAAVDELLTRRGLRAPFLRLAQSGATLADREFTSGGGVGAGVADQVDEDAVRRRFAAGATIVLQGLHRTWPPIADLAGPLASELGHPVQVNAYVTPPGNQGFSAHYDVHDVFVLQVHGTKSWRVHAPVWPSPLRDQTWERRRASVEAAAAGPPLVDVALTPGDLLYLPRGYLHSASAPADSEVSVHLTIGIHTWTRAHLVDALVAAARDTLVTDPALRASLAACADVADLSAPENRADLELVREALGAAVAQVPPETIARHLRARVRDSQRPAPVGVLRQVADADRLVPGDRLRVRAQLGATLEAAAQAPAPSADARGPSPAPVLLRSRAGLVPLPAAAEPALGRLLAGEDVLACELLPGDPAGSLELGRRLLVEGVAERSAGVS